MRALSTQKTDLFELSFIVAQRIFYYCLLMLDKRLSVELLMQENNKCCLYFIHQQNYKHLEKQQQFESKLRQFSIGFTKDINLSYLELTLNQNGLCQNKQIQLQLFSFHKEMKDKQSQTFTTKFSGTPHFRLWCRESADVENASQDCFFSS